MVVRIALHGHEVASPLGMAPSWCVCYPVLEEMLYRLVLCAPLVALLGPWYAIVISGAAFGALHFLYGNPAPTNFVAGYLLAWPYLRSGSKDRGALLLILVAVLYDRRAKYEERILSHDRSYVEYLRQVKYRFVPGVY